MKLKSSPLQSIDFLVLESHLKAIVPDNDKKLKFNPKNYQIDFDFDISQEKEAAEHFVVSLNIEINKPKKDGYYIFVKGYNSFHIDGIKDLEIEMIENLKFRSSVSIAIANLRAYIINLTSNFIFPTYHLPSIDFLDLLKKKSRLAQIKHKKSKIKRKDK